MLWKKWKNVKLFLLIYKKGTQSNNKIYFILSGSVTIVQITKKDFRKSHKSFDFNKIKQFKNMFGHKIAL